MSWSLGARGRVAGTVLVAAALVVGPPACSWESETGASVTQPFTTTQTSASVAPSTTSPASSSTTAMTPAPVVAPSTTTSSAVSVVSTVPMPNVMCMNHQDAQNLIQELGILYSPSTDATGKGRNQVLDANWVVVGQTPGVGVPIGDGDAVLSVVKLTEPNPC